MTDTPQSPQKLNTTLAHGFAWTAGAKWATQLITWGSVLLAARILTPSDFGLVDMAAFFVGLTNIVAEFGLGAAVLQIRNLDRDVLAQLHTFSVMLGVAAFSCSFLAAPYVADFFHNDKLLLLVIVTSLSFLITGFQMVPLGLLQKALDYRRLSLTEAAMACTQALVLMIGVLTGVGYWALVMAVLSGKAVSALLVNIWHPVSFRWPRWRQIVEPARLGWHLTVSRVGWAAYAQADSIVVGKVLGAGSLGTYRIATDLASAPSEKLGMLIMRVTGPFFASVQSDTATVRRYFILFSESLALSVFPMMFGIAAISQDLIPVVLGNHWSGAVTVLRWLSFYVVFRTLNTLMGQVLTSLHHTRFMMWTSLLSAAVMVPTFIIASRWGIGAVAASWLLLSPVTIGIPAFWLLRRIDLSAVEYLKVLAPAVISCAIMVAGVLLTAHWLPPQLGGYPRLGIQIMVGAILYTSALWLLFRPTVQRYLRFLSQLRAGQSATGLKSMEKDSL